MEFLSKPWPWYVAGPLLGLIVPLLLLLGNKQFGISGTLRDFCAIVLPTKLKFFQYDVKQNLWNIFFVAGIIIGGFLCHQLFTGYDAVQISQDTINDLQKMGITDFSGLAPKEIFNFKNLLTPPGFVFMILGGFIVGFGVRYAGGCTSGHGIMGLSQLSGASVAALIGFFAGGLIMVHFIFPLFF